MIDVHCHFEEEDITNIDEILEECKKVGVQKVIASGYDITSSMRVLKLVENYDVIYGSVGFSPEVLKKGSYDLVNIDDLLKHPKIVALGEIGLDYYWYSDNKEEQKELFLNQIELAKKNNKPIIVHCRDAMQDCYEVLKSSKVDKFIMHCYSGSVEMAKQFISIGGYISIGGVATFKNAKQIVSVIKEIPLEYIVVETDSPYLTPEPFRGKKNFPYYLPYIVEKIADIKNMKVNQVIDILKENTHSIIDFY